MAQFTKNKGATTFSVGAYNDSFRFYSSGVLTVDNCPDTLFPDHQIVQVGFQLQEDGKHHFKVQNSWGSADWGINGEGWIEEYACGTFKIDDYAPII